HGEAANVAEIKTLGSDIDRHLAVINSVALRVPARNLRKLASLSFVKHLSADVLVKKCDEFTCGSSMGSAANQQYGVTGKGIRIAVLDSGVHASRDLRDAVANDTRRY